MKNLTNIQNKKYLKKLIKKQNGKYTEETGGEGKGKVQENMINNHEYIFSGEKIYFIFFVFRA